MSRSRLDTGTSGERLAGRYLASRGFRILRRNYRTPFGEIDIVAEYGGCLVFLEVKTRISERAGTPLSAVTISKQKHIIKNSQYYLLKHNLDEKPCRIDVISVNLDRTGRLRVLKHVKNAFGTDVMEHR